MYYGINTESEVLKNFERIAKEEGLVKTAADYDGIEAKENYNVTSETGDGEVADAHPGGGTVVPFDMKPADNADRVETIVEQHKINEGIARQQSATAKVAYAVNLMIKLADAIEQDGLELEDNALFEVSNVLDEAINKVVATARKK